MPAVSGAQVYVHAPEELTHSRLRRLGEGIGKVVYASEHWVVKRERSPFEIVALIVLWKSLRRLERFLPGHRLLEKPGRQLRFLRVTLQGALALIPSALWFKGHIRQMWREYHLRNARGERLARERLAGSPLLPLQITFPPVRVNVGGWPGSLMVSEASERVEATLFARLAELARRKQFDEIRCWLDRFLDARQQGWKTGLFSADAHLKNYGVIQDRVVLLDTGGLTNRWDAVEKQINREQAAAEPHSRLGLAEILAGRPDIAAWFDARWKEIVSHSNVREIWPEER